MFILKALPALSILFCLIPVTADAQTRSEDHSYDELGRLKSTIGGGTTSGEARSWCFDENGNRTEYKADDAGATLICTAPDTPSAEPGNPAAPSGPPAATGNLPPEIDLGVTIPGACNTSITAYTFLTNHVVDPDNGTLQIDSVIKTGSGPATVSIVSGLYLQISFGTSYGWTSFSISVSDGAGGTDTETFTVETTDNCPTGPETETGPPLGNY